MQLKRLVLKNFRNYKTAEISFLAGIHIIYGENGAGKTSILEAIHTLALTKSFRTTTDKHLILNKEKMFRVQGEFYTAQDQRIDTAIAYATDSGKHLTVNGQKMQKFSEFIGDIPLVLLHPADLQLSQGSPQQRRRFLDVLLSQSSKLYLHHLIQYNRALKQRNQLLSRMAETGVNTEILFPWEENLITHGIALIERRKSTADQLNMLVKESYQSLSQKGDKTKIVYQNNIKQNKDEDLAQAYRRLFDAKRRQECAYGTTLIGPHRDDLLFLINGQPLKAVASQGEHKTFVIALKLAEFQHLQEQHSQSPILLFDDIFGELDALRIEQMLGQLSNIGQVFVTTTSRNFFDKVHGFSTPTHYYQVVDGEITLLAS